MENKINILLVSPYKGTVGGISRWTGHILNYYNNLKDKSIELTQYYSEGKDIYGDTSKIKRIYQGIKIYLPFLKNLNKKLKKNKFDAIHFTSSASYGLIRDYYTIKIAKKRDTKTIIHFRFGRIPEIYKSQNWEYKLINKIIKLSDKVIVIDKFSYNTLLKKGYNNIVFLPNPLTPKVNKIISNTNVEREYSLILFAGHVLKTKGVFELVEATKDIPNIQVRIIGNVSDDIKKELLNIAGENNKFLEIIGEVDYETTIKEMLKCELFVLPTYTEGFPNVILESMACGCPIIASSVGAIPEMLNINGDTHCGICIEPKNIKQLRDSILYLLENKDKAKELGTNAKKRVNEEYSMPIVWKKLLNIWESTIN